MFTKGKAFFYYNRYIILAFFVPFILMFAAYAAADFYPFGENQVAVIDMYHQYFPFISQLQEKLQTGGSLLYSWNGGMGTNFVTLLSYYAASPLYFLTVFVPQEYLMEAVTLIILIKISLASAFMAVYLRSMHKKCDCATVAFSTLYGLCAYVMGYYWCLMWLDTVALLPLCMLGLNRLLDRERVKLYTISLAAIMITNYYTGGMICIFILFYYPILYFSKYSGRGALGCARITGKAVLCSITGILIAGITLLPTFLNMQNSYYIDSEMPEESSFYHSLLDIVTNLLPKTELTVREGLPNIYCGLICVMLAVLFMTIRTIPLKRRILNSGLMAFLILSFNWNKLDFIWHGLHFPNQLPFRYSFVFSFLLVILAYEAFLHIREIAPKHIGIVTLAGAGYVILAQKLYEDKFDPEFAYVCLALLFLYGGFLAIYRTGRYHQPLMRILLLLIVAGEMVINTSAAVEKVSFTNRAEYFSESSQIEKLIKDTRKQDTGFYRMEVFNPLILNSPMLYHYPGVSEFSSTVNGDISYFMEHIGLEAEDVKNRYNYVMTTPVANAMLGIKYIISKGTSIEREPALTLTGGEELSCLYENKYYLPPGYMADKAVLDTWDYSQENPFNVLNDFVRLAAGEMEQVFRPMGVPQISGTNVTLGEYYEGQVDCTSNGSSPQVDLVFTVPSQQQVYVFAETSGAESITAQTEQGHPVSIKEDCGAAVSIGTCQAGETVTIHITYEGEEAGNITAYAYGLNQAAWDRAYARLSDETLQVTSHSDTSIEGTIEVMEDGVFLTSVPYEKGWTLKIDGKEQEIDPLGDAFVAAPLKAGTHKVELTYMPDGLIPGILMTLCGIGILIALSMIRRRKGEKGSGTPLHPGPQAEEGLPLESAGEGSPQPPEPAEGTGSPTDSSASEKPESPEDVLGTEESGNKNKETGDQPVLKKEKMQA